MGRCGSRSASLSRHGAYPSLTANDAFHTTGQIPCGQIRLAPANHEVGFVRFHACSSSTATLAMSRVAILWNAANPSPALVYRTPCDRPENKRGAAAYLSALTRIRGSTMLSLLSLLTRSH